MKKKKSYLFALLIVSLVAGIANANSEAKGSPTPTPAPTPNAITISIKKDSGLVSLKDALTDVAGKKVLVIDKNEVVELVTEGKVTLESKNRDSVRVLDNKYLVGIAADTESEITVKKEGSNDSEIEIAIAGVDKFIVKVRDADASRQIVAQSTFLSYKTVKDNFGKKFAQSYFVIQVDIRNEKLDKQFIVQTLDVILDPNQCVNGLQLYADFDVGACKAIFDKFFIFPKAQQYTRSEEIIGSGKADLSRSNRNLGFRILAFVANMGTILTGFDGVLGPDGVKGVNVLGTTVTGAANGLFPNTADEKLENLRKAAPTEDVIIKSKESKTFNIFIPTDRIFYDESWKKYILAAKESDRDTFTLKSVLDIALLASATGVLVDNDAPKVQVQSDDSLTKQKDKFAIKTRLRAEYNNSVTIRSQLIEISNDLLGTNSQKKAARKRIINALKKLKTSLKLEIKIDETVSDNDLFTQLQNIISDATSADEIPTKEILDALKKEE
jgi:hypothetical protein